MKKAALPFLPLREHVEVVVQKRAVREEVAIDPNPTETGYASQGGVVARVRPGTQGKEGKSVFGRLVPAPRRDPAPGRPPGGRRYNATGVQRALVYAIP